MDTEELRKKIQALRSELIKVGRENQWADHETIAASQKLDEMLVSYENFLNRKDKRVRPLEKFSGKISP